MRRFQSISPGVVCKLGVQWLVQAFQWPVKSAVAGPELLTQLLVRACCQLRSLSAVVAEAANVPCLQSIRNALSSSLPKQAADFLPSATRALQSRLPKSLFRRPQTMAIDLHLRPYYGDKKTKGIYRGQSKASTKKFFAYATLLVIRRGQSFTVGLTPVANREPQTDMLQRLLKQAEQAGLRVRRLLLDRGFYGATTIKWLQDRSISFIMPVIRRGKSGSKKADCTGTSQFFVKNRRGWEKYTWKSRRDRGRKKQPAFTVTVDICMVPRSMVNSRIKPSRRRSKPNKKAKKRTGPLVYACHGVQASPKQISIWYRRRFQIETSYRQMGQGLAATCSKDPVYRLLLATIALVLRNLWVWLHWCYLKERIGDKLVLHHENLRMLTMMSWIARALNKQLGMRPQAITTCSQLT